MPPAVREARRGWPSKRPASRRLARTCERREWRQLAACGAGITAGGVELLAPGVVRHTAMLA